MAKGAYIGVETALVIKPLKEVTVGTTVKINEKGSPVDYLVIQQGNPDASLYDTSCDGTWLLRKDVFGTSVWTSGKEHYGNSVIHSYLNSTYLSAIDDDVQAVIKQAKIPYRSSYDGSTISSGSNGLSTKAFLLSYHELNLDYNSGALTDGVCLNYFANASTSADAKRIAHLNGTATDWWTRTGQYGNNGNSFWVTSAGYRSNGNNSTNTLGVRPAIILPSNCAVINGTVTSETAESAGTVTRSLARKIKKGYIGVDGVARKIKKAYIGIGGVARPCWSGGELAYYGTITPLSEARYDLAATSIGNYALFFGGQTTSSQTTAIDAYDTSLTRSSPEATSVGRFAPAATTIGNYALFGGGAQSGGNVPSQEVDAYNSSLTHSWPSDLEYTYGHHLASTTVGNYALFAGGNKSSGSSPSNGVTSYNASLTRGQPTTLSSTRHSLAATTVGNYALFGGGFGSKSSHVVDAYNTSLTRSIPTGLDVARSRLAATTVGNYALFGGGYGSSTQVDAVDAYDKSLTRTTPTALSAIRAYLAATTAGGYAIFSGGYSDSSGTGNITDCYDESLTRTVRPSESPSRRYHAATTVGNYALFGGGETGGASASHVWAYTVA